MNPPGLRTRVLGHPPVSGVLVFMGALMCYGWWAQGAEDAIGVIGLILALLGMKEYDSLAKYKRWQRQWNELAGEDGRDHRRSGGFARIGGAIAAYVLIAYVAITPGFAPKDVQGIAALTLLVLTAGLFVKLLVRLRRRLRHSRTAKAAADARQFEVQQVLPVARGSTAARDTIQMVPDYCKELMLRPRQ